MGQYRQTTPLLTYTENAVTHPVGDTGDPDLALHPEEYRTPVPAETRTYELTGFRPPDDLGRFSFDAWEKDGFQRLTVTQEIQYEEDPPADEERKRLIERVHTLYRPDDCGVVQHDPLALLPLGRLQPLALPGESYKLAFTPASWHRSSSATTNRCCCPTPAPSSAAPAQTRAATWICSAMDTGGSRRAGPSITRTT